MSIWTDLLFQHGYIANVEQARALAPAGERPRAPATGPGLPVAAGADRARRPQPCLPTFASRGVAGLCAVALSQFR